MHVRPLRQYVYHGALIAACTLALPWCVALNMLEDWIKGKTLGASIKDAVWDFGEGVTSLALDDITDMSYLDEGEYIDL